MMSGANKREKVAIIGTGSYGIAIGKRLVEYGFEVVYGSRNPDLAYLKHCFENKQQHPYISVTSSAHAWQQSDRFVFFAVAAFNSVYESIVQSILKTLSKKENPPRIVIEVSNLTDDQHVDKVKISNAEKLQTLIQQKLDESSLNCQISVIKGFNLISAGEISTHSEKSFNKESLTSGFNQSVPIAGDSGKAKEAVVELCAKIGLRAYDIGSLNQSALKLEVTNKKTFNDWYYPSLISIGFFLFNFVWIFFNYFLFPKSPVTFEKYLDYFSLLSHSNKCAGYTSLQLIALVYFTSILASIYQLVNSTKYKRFPKYLDFCLKTRKQFGLWGFYMGTFHAIATIYIMNPMYLADWFRQPDHLTKLTILRLDGELAILLGILAYILLAVLALTSINAIGTHLTMNEWRFVQTKLGLLSLFLGFAHDAVMYYNIFKQKDAKNYSVSYLMTRAKLTALYFPFLVLVLRFVFSYFPPISQRLEQIRTGAAQNKSKTQ
jgi:predicted dinucleotide-binding enzyme/DMSO/TMAO reductase YedYZ heme-binding membrane subunit